MFTTHFRRLLMLCVVVGLVTAVLSMVTAVTAQQPVAPPAPDERALLPHLPTQGAEQEVGQAILYPPDWSKGVFQSYRDGNWEVYSSQPPYRLTNHGSSDMHPRYNRGATHIVFSSNREGDYEIYVMNVDGSGLQQLTYDSTHDVNPIWSPDGSRIAFQSYRDGQSELYVMNANGANLVRLTAHGAYDGDPTWSPDGSKIAFRSSRTGTPFIYVMNSDGTGIAQLSAQPSFYAAWSPDGSQIAYTADLDGDDFFEMWLMNANGSNQRMLLDPSGQQDAWVRGWSPNGREILFTHIQFIQYQGNWYWEWAYISSYDPIQNWSATLDSTGLDWHPDWQTADIAPPTSTVNPLPAQSIYQFSVNWSGQDNGIAGIEGYDVQYKIGVNGVWTDHQINDPSTGWEISNGIGGQTYYFRVRARDYASNVEPWPANSDASTTIESAPPQSTVFLLAPFTRINEQLLLDWDGYDPGNSGVAEYDIQYRLGNGNWIDWTTSMQPPAHFTNPTPGQTYYFRIRGRDRAQNAESWTTGNGDTSTSVYTWGIAGTAHDNAGVPIQNITLTTNPASFHIMTGDSEGHYAGHIATEAITYTVGWEKDGYGDLPATDFPAVNDAQLNVVLPPADNILVNSGFESGSFQPGWASAGTTLPVVTDTVRNTGQYAALLGTIGQETVDVFLGTGSKPRLALGPDNTVHVLWKDYNGALQYAWRNSQGVWSTVQTLANQVLDDPQLAVDGTGTAHVVWEVMMTGIYYRQRPSDGSWSTTQTVHTSNEPWLRSKMAVTTNGIVHVIWESSTGLADDVFYRRRTSGGAWSAVENATNSGLHNADSQLVVANNGVVHVVSKEGQGGLVYVRRPPNGTWSANETIFMDNYEAVHFPRLAVDDNGRAYVTWNFRYYNQSDSHYYFAERGINGGWSAPYTLAEAGGLLSQDIVVGPDQTVHFVFGDYDEGSYRQRPAGGSWSEIQELVTPSTEGMQYPQIAIDTLGLAHVVWGITNGYGHVYYVRQMGDGSWTEPDVLTNQPGGELYPQMAIDEYNLPHIVWSGVYYNGPSLAEQVSDSWLTQMFTIPVTMTTPVLSFLYQMGQAIPDGDSNLVITVDDGTDITSLLEVDENTAGWSHQWADLSQWAGEVVTVTFHLHQAAGTPEFWSYVDEITVGAAHSDVWVTIASTVSALPGEQGVFNVTYGNRGGAIASNNLITFTLPADISFVSATIPPVTTSPLVFNLGDFAANSAPGSFMITGLISPLAAPFTTLTSTAVISTDDPELELLNNQAEGRIYTATFRYLPIIMR